MAPLISFFHHLPWVTIFGLLGDTISFLVFISPIPTFYRIYKKKSTEGFQSVPYVVALFSAMLWIFYALLIPNSTFLMTINSFGCFIETVYITIFLLYAAKEARISTMKLIFVMNVAGFGAILFITLFIAKTAQVRVKIVGWICLIFNLCVFAAPLGVMRQVIRTKSVKYMPFLLSFFLTIGAVMWFFYGLLRKDYNIAIPNVLGFSFGIAQMVLYAMYRKSTKSMEDLIEEQKIPSELATTTDHQIIEVVKLGSQEKLSSLETPRPQFSIIVNKNNNNNNVNDDRSGNEERIYAVEIRNVNREMIEKIKKISGLDVETTPNAITVPA